ncbi:probable ATP-dependent DNA helicase HFM1 [Oppia nitens]|uniref:probable ATP-dependent DNA helicase HFM1 n=1 Tax=Oppia nitens TaxID=1686743 RepID=UPI0023DAAD50|nr:probable ATP-dependent DNA helicase HFM1 [Oppia nitens]
MNEFRFDLNNVRNDHQNHTLSQWVVRAQTRTDIDPNASNQLVRSMVADNNNDITDQYSTDGTLLRRVSELPPKYRPIFDQRFPVFNVIQSKVFDDILFTNKSIAICSPTGSGKTAVFEMAIIRQLMSLDKNDCPLDLLKVVYMAPLKKLVDEKYRELKQSFDSFGINCLQLTGDSDIKDYELLKSVNIVVTTPEKWDYMIRNHENTSLIRSIQLMLIDEIHCICDETRGATIEAVISRMKTLRSIDMNTNSDCELRFVAASATAPNVDDISHWLDPNNSIGYNLSDAQRPVRLQKIVIGYHFQKSWSEFRFDIQLSYKLDSIIRTYCESKPTLIFCSTRKAVLMTAQTLCKSSINVFNSFTQRNTLLMKINTLKNLELKMCTQKGVAFHHSGLERADRSLIESLFIDGLIPVLISTTTLAMGVNLPAHLVVIKNTVQYTQNGCQEYPETQILQMIGRAGRPQFDKNAFAVIMTKEESRFKYERLLNGTQVIESCLHRNLVEHLNAEIALKTVTSLDIAINWIQSTFLYIRVMQNPIYYGNTSQMSTIDQCLQMVHNWCAKELTGLKDANMIAADTGLTYVSPTPLGKIMAKYSVSLHTMIEFCNIVTQEFTLRQTLEVICRCNELKHEVQLRVNEKTILNELNKSQKQPTIRYPFNGKIKTADMKINCLIQASFGALTIPDATLNQELTQIMRTGQRLTKCLAEVMYFNTKDKINAINSKTVLNAIILNKCIKAKLWHDSPQVTIQLNRIGPKMSKALVNKGYKSFNDIKNADPRDIEFCLKRNAPFGRLLIDEIRHLPYYSVTIEEIIKNKSKRDKTLIKISVKLENLENLFERSVLVQNHCCYLIVCDDDNQLLYCYKLFDSQLIKNNGSYETKNIDVFLCDRTKHVRVHLISDSFVGLDVECTLRLAPADAYRSTADPNRSKAFSDTSWESRDNSESAEGCQHKCADKSSCGHSCCKKGLTSSYDSTNKQVKKIKKQNVDEKHENQVKRLKQTNSSLDDWVIKMDKTSLHKTHMKSESTDCTQSHYFNNNSQQNKLVIPDITDDFNDDFTDDFNEDFTDEDIPDISFDTYLNVKSEPTDETDFSADLEFDTKCEQLFTCSEDFQRFDSQTTNQLIDSTIKQETSHQYSQSNTIKDLPFSMSQWSLFMPTIHLEGKSFFNDPHK